MENESLDIFNSVLILASPETALDTDYASILGVIGHEYFHNWTGNRVIWVAQVQNLQTPAETYEAARPPQSYGGWAPDSKKREEQKFAKIDDNYNNLEQVTEALAHAGLESSNLIVGIAFTKSNEWAGVIL